MIAAPRGRGSETRGNPEATFAGFIQEGISSLRGTRHPQCEPCLPDPSSTSASTAATASQALTSQAPPFAPSTSLQELRRMGESLHLAEIRIQRALRAKLLLELYAKLQKEAKRIDAGVGMGGGPAYSEVERALALDKIEPELPIVDCDSTGVKERPSSLRRHAKQFHRSVREHKWRFVPVGDPALDLQRLLILGRLSGDLYTRLQSMLSASHMMRLLRMLLNKVGGGSRVTTAARRHHEIQCRLEDDIMFLFEEIDVDRTTPSPRVGLVMRVCAESMRQLWPHVTGDGASKGSISMATGADTDRASASSSTSSMAGSRSWQRSPGPLVQLFVELSLQPLLNWRRLFSNSEAAAEKRVNGLQEQADERENASCERRQLLCDQLTDLLRRARRLLLHRLMVLRMSLGASDDEADSNGVDKGVNNVGVSRNLNDSGISKAPSAFAGKSHLRPKDPTIQLTNHGITETHQHFVERLVDAVYFDEECGIAKALSQAFVPCLSQLLNTLGADGPGKNSPEESRGGRTSCGDSNGSHLSAGCGGIGSFVNTASGSACSDTSPEPEGDTNSTNSTNKESNPANHANTFLASFIKNGEQSRLMEAHRIAWTTVKDMRQAGERLAAARAAYCIRKKFRPVLELHMKVEKRLLWHYIQALARGRAREDIWLRQCDPTPQEHHSPLTKKILTRLETEGREFVLGSMRRIVELMRVELDACFSTALDGDSPTGALDGAPTGSQADTGRRKAQLPWSLSSTSTFGRSVRDVSVFAAQALRSKDMFERTSLRNSVGACRARLSAIWCEFLQAFEKCLLVPQSQSLQHYMNLSSNAFSVGSNNKKGAATCGIATYVRGQLPGEQENGIDRIASNIGRGVHSLQTLANILFDTTKHVVAPCFRATGLHNSSTEQGKIPGMLHVRSSHAMARGLSAKQSLGELFPLSNDGPQVHSKRPFSRRGNLHDSLREMVDSENTKSESNECLSEENSGLHKAAHHLEAHQADILNVTVQKIISTHVHGALQAPLQRAQVIVERALNECWLGNCTVAPARHILRTSQRREDFLVRDNVNPHTNLSDSPTEACRMICELWSRRRLECCGGGTCEAKTTGFLTGTNQVSMDRVLGDRLMNLIWDHVQTQKIDFTGALRLQIDLETYFQACRRTTLESSVRANRIGQRSFELLRTMAGVLAVSTDHIPDLVREVPGISSLSKDDFLRFMKCRADFSEKSGSGIVRWIEEFYALGGMSA